MLVRPYLEFCVQFFPLHYRTDTDILERVLQRDAKMMNGLEQLLMRQCSSLEISRSNWDMGLGSSSSNW